MLRVLVLAAAILLPVSVLAQSFVSINRMEVIPQPNGGMEVIEKADTGVRDVWCAAGDYVRRVLGNPTRARLYLTKPHGPSQSRPGRNSVGFTITPDAQMASNGPSYSASLRDIGTNLSVASSYSYCDDVLFEDFRDR